MKDLIISIDQGTSSCRAIAYDLAGKTIGICQKEFEQIYPKPGWVEHDPMEIWNTQQEVLSELIRENSIPARQIKGIGITNQRETTVVWNKFTGEPIYNAIVWQDKRTIDYCAQLKHNNLEKYIRKNTGLVIDSYFSGTKIQWILNNVSGAREKAEKGELLFGTIDTWLIWNFTKRKVHATDYSNASRTMLFNILELCWDEKLLEALEIPSTMLPVVQDSASLFGHSIIEDEQIPICAVAGDQQAALFGQRCFEAGEAKNTYGTGCFMLLNTGNQPIESSNGLLTTIAWGLDNKITYALEGSVFIAGAAIQWLRDGLHFFRDAKDSEHLALQSNENDLIVVPAFSGLGSPYWNMDVKGAIFGITRDTGINEITKATLESIALQTNDVLKCMEKDAQINISSLKVDGGASANNYLMQFQADITEINVNRAENVESTAYGVFLLAARFLKFEAIFNTDSIVDEFIPQMSKENRRNKVINWQSAISQLINRT